MVKINIGDLCVREDGRKVFIAYADNGFFYGATENMEGFIRYDRFGCTRYHKAHKTDISHKLKV